MHKCSMHCFDYCRSSFNKKRDNTTMNLVASKKSWGSYGCWALEIWGWYALLGVGLGEWNCVGTQHKMVVRCGKPCWASWNVFLDEFTFLFYYEMHMVPLVHLPWNWEFLSWHGRKNSVVKRYRQMAKNELHFFCM